MRRADNAAHARRACLSAIVAAMEHAPDHERRLGDLIRFGTVAAVDLAAQRCTVTLTDELLSGPLPWLAGRAGAVSAWSPPTVGEQVVLLCPEGDIAAGVVLLGLYSDANPAPAGDTHPLLKLPDGSTLRYDADAHELAVSLAQGAKLTLAAPGGATITGDLSLVGKLAVQGDVTVQGGLSVSGDIAARGDVKAGTVSLKGHVHLGVQGGSGLSGAPKP